METRPVVAVLSAPGQGPWPGLAPLQEQAGLFGHAQFRQMKRQVLSEQFVDNFRRWRQGEALFNVVRKGDR
jgi:hypothetical protein